IALYFLIGARCIFFLGRRTIGRRLQFHAGRDADAVELRQPVGRRLALLEIGIERVELAERRAGPGGSLRGGLCREAPLALERRVEPAAAALQRREHERDKQRREAEQSEGHSSRDPQIGAETEDLIERKFHFLALQAAEIENETGFCGSALRISWRASCTC